jgi:hypothetical protein
MAGVATTPVAHVVCKNTLFIIHSAVGLTTGPKPLSKQAELPP